MNFVNKDTITLNRVSITNMLQEIGPEEVIRDIVRGLLESQKKISSKYFYNGKGSLLFEEITHLKEYYPTRTEKAILKKIAPALMEKYAGYEIIELGPGDHSKISLLLNAADGLNLASIRYLPLDISQPALRSSAESLVRTYPDLRVEGYALDFFSQFEPIQREQPALICFFGSTIGNFEWGESLELLRNISLQMKKGDVLLLGMDLVKPEAVLFDAYNDAQGITAAFNKNILNSVNDLIDSDFQDADFDHLAFFNKAKSRIEMHLVARQELKVSSPHLKEVLHFKKGESIHTENSHKYDTSHIQRIVKETGLRLNFTYSDERDWFALTEFQKS
jgi:L-histidine Nalpha-methyltransferase